MFCTKCGAENDDNARFCVECGAKLGNSGKGIRPPSYDSEADVSKKMWNVGKYKKIIPIIILVILAVLLVSKLILPGQTEKKVIKNIMSAEMTGDVDKIMDIVPEDLWDAAEKEGLSRKEIKEELQDVLSEARDSLDSILGENWKYSYKIKNIEKVPKEDLEDIRETYKDAVGKEVNISEAKKVQVELTVKTKDTEKSETMTIYIIKIKNKWYLDFSNLDSLNVL